MWFYIKIKHPLICALSQAKYALVCMAQISVKSAKEVLHLTKNQIEYLKHKEQQRANVANEELTRRRDATTRELGFANLTEVSRHNLAYEENARFVAQEQRRHNFESEAISRLGLDLQRKDLDLKGRSLDETIRHNVASEQVSLGQLELNRQTLLEQARHNVANEKYNQDQLTHSRNVLGEQIRHNQASEILTSGQMYETSRHNLAVEDVSRYRAEEERRANLAREGETRRHNIVSEGLTSQQIGLGYANVNLGYQQLAEQARSNVSRETETHRANIAHEMELNRSNLARESENHRSNIARESETHRANLYSERQRNTVNREQKRHNYTLEELERTRNTQGWITSVSRAIDSGSRFIPIIGGMLG